jgi:hypothetical protein
MITSGRVTLENDFGAHGARRAEYAAFRAKHRSLSDAIAACERPDWLILLAFEAAPHSKEVIALGSDAASLSGDTSYLRKWAPLPFPLEVVDAYSNNTRLAGQSDKRTRAINVGLLGAVLIMFLVDSWWGCHLGALRYQTDAGVMLLALVPLIPLINAVFAVVVKRRAAALANERALEIVLAEIEKGMMQRPERVSVNTDLVRRRVMQLVEQRA